MSSRAAEFDLVVRGGLVVDGSGTPGARGDVAVVGDRVVAVGEVEGRGREELEVDGMVVAPGFVDAHTHMDAQVFWDELGKADVLARGDERGHGQLRVHPRACPRGRAGAGGAQLGTRRGHRAGSDGRRDHVERGRPSPSFSTRSTPDPRVLNHAAAIGHSALRTWAMGERAFEETANEDDLAAMALELRVRAACRAPPGSRHRAPSLTSPPTIARSRHGKLRGTRWWRWSRSSATRATACSSWRPSACSTPTRTATSKRVSPGWRSRAARPSCSGCSRRSCPNPRSSSWTRRRREAATCTRSRIAVGSCRRSRSCTRLGFDCLPEWQEVRRRPYPEQQALLRDPDVRRRLVHAAHHGDYGPTYGPEAGRPRFDTNDHPGIAVSARTRRLPTRRADGASTRSRR